MKKFLVILTACAFLGPLFNACSDNDKECSETDITCLRHCALKCMNDEGQFESTCINSCGFPEDGNNSSSNEGYNCSASETFCIQICTSDCMLKTGNDEATCTNLCSAGAY